MCAHEIDLAAKAASGGRGRLARGQSEGDGVASANQRQHGADNTEAAKVVRPCTIPNWLPLLVVLISMLGCFRAAPEPVSTQLTQTIGFLYGQAVMENVIGRVGNHPAHIASSCKTLSDADGLAAQAGTLFDRPKIDTMDGMKQLRESCAESKAE